MEALAFAALLLVIDNTLRHEAPPPRSTPAIARELLARPLDARDAAAIFDRVVPRPLVAAAAAHPSQAVQPFQRLLSDYVEELARAREELLTSTGNAPLDMAALLADVTEHGHPSVDRLLQVEAATDSDGLAVANERFITATLHFALALRSASDLPTGTTRFDTKVGTIIIGGQGDDAYELAPAIDGTAYVVIDLGGNDTYKGSNVALRGFSAIVDFAGDDRYELSGPGLGAAIGGASLVLDFAGNDRYRAPHLAQGAAAFGIGALIDLAGDDQYDVDAWGQGFGLAGGLGLLWDAAGNDQYIAHGPPDAFNRGGGLSGAQGTAMGPRNFLAGGIGILRDDDGDDSYAAELFAQGTGYYYGLGLLWDRAGDDRYRAVRYAQGTGVHQAVGVLRDDAGNDRYDLSVGVGQGMGLDLAVGVLVDAGGDDEYRSASLAQATGTANGVGVLEDGGGADRFELASGERQWGHAEWDGGLPTTGIFRYDPSHASFTLAGKPLAAPPAPHKVTEAEPQVKCPAAVGIDPAEIENVRREYFEAAMAVAGRMICAVADPAQADTLWPAFESELARHPDSVFAGAIAMALHLYPPPEPIRQAVLARLDAHPYCSVRAAALSVAPRAEVALRALSSTCYRLQAAAVRALEKLGTPIPADAPLPAFLR